MPGTALRQTRGPVFWSVMGHGIVVLLMVVNLPSLRTGTNQPVQLAIEAAVVTDVQAVRERERDAETRRRLEREKAAAARQEQERRQQELDRQKAAQQRQAEAEKQRVEAERIAVKRREEAEQKRRDEARQKAAEEKQRQAAAEKQRQAAEARRREAERQQQQREAQLAAQLAAEQQREDAVRGGLLDQWVEVIRQKVQRNWVNPPSAGTGIECEVRVTQIPGGEVVNVRISSCNADAAVVRSIENAVYKASPLPPPPDASLFERNIIFNFKPVD
ncbi:MAG: cell envelope integrity protein TolA [Gammaproteobacteria bacterium]